MLGWLTRIVVVLAVLGVVGYDAISVAVAHVDATDLANRAANAASAQWQASHDIHAAYDAAAEVAATSGATVLTGAFSAETDGTVELTVRKQATTVLLDRIGPLRSWATVSAHGEGRTIS